MAGICQPRLGCSWNENIYFLIVEGGGNMLHFLIIESGGDMSVVVLLMTCNYALLESEHCCLLSPTMIASPRPDHSLYPFSHPEICLLGLRMEESHPWREWNMNQFCTVDFVQGLNQTQTISWWKPLKNAGSSSIGNTFLDPRHERTFLL